MIVLKEFVIVLLFGKHLLKKGQNLEDTTRQLCIQSTNKLVLDCQTSWNSTYFMLSVTLVFKNMFPRLKIHESKYKHLPIEED